MLRRGGAVALVVAAVLTAGACGGTDWNAAHKPKTPPPAALRAQAAAEARAELPYVDALVASDQANARADQTNPLEIRCLASALVHGVGVQTFRAHRLTPSFLRDPNSTLDALPAPTAAQINTIGAALQRCPLSSLGQSFAQGVGVTDAATADCFTKGLARPDTRRFLVFMMYGRDKVDLATAQAEVSFLGRCTDLAALFTQAALPRTVDSSTRQCFVTALHGADAALKNYWALKIAHADSDQVQQASDALGVAINQCRPGAQTGFTVPPN